MDSNDNGVTRLLDFIKTLSTPKKTSDVEAANKPAKSENGQVQPVIIVQSAPQGAQAAQSQSAEKPAQKAPEAKAPQAPGGGQAQGGAPQMQPGDFRPLSQVVQNQPALMPSQVAASILHNVIQQPSSSDLAQNAGDSAMNASQKQKDQNKQKSGDGGGGMAFIKEILAMLGV